MSMKGVRFALLHAHGPRWQRMSVRWQRMSVRWQRMSVRCQRMYSVRCQRMSSVRWQRRWGPLPADNHKAARSQRSGYITL